MAGALGTTPILSNLVAGRGGETNFSVSHSHTLVAVCRLNSNGVDFGFAGEKACHSLRRSLLLDGQVFIAGNRNSASRAQLSQRQAVQTGTPQITASRESEPPQELNPVQRLTKAWALFWSVLLPPPPKRLSSAEKARERLRLLLFYERGELSAELRGKLRETIVEALSSYVDISYEDEVSLSCNPDPSCGTVYSVTVPVKRVKPEFQEVGRKEVVFQAVGREEEEREERLYRSLGEERRFVLRDRADSRSKAMIESGSYGAEGGREGGG